MPAGMRVDLGTAGWNPRLPLSLFLLLLLLLCFWYHFFISGLQHTTGWISRGGARVSGARAYWAMLFSPRHE